VWAKQGLVFSIGTQITSTPLYTALKTNDSDIVLSTTEPCQQDGCGLLNSTIPPSEKALARGLKMGELIEELSRNLTLSLFSVERLLVQNGTTVMVVQTATNVYSYSLRYLINEYAVDGGIALLCIIFGTYAMYRTNYSHETSLRAIRKTMKTWHKDEASDNSNSSDNDDDDDSEENILSTLIDFVRSILSA